MEKENLWDYGKALAFFGFIFFALLAFFTEAHPLVPYDGDDWYNLAGFHRALPHPGVWNPIKVLPEDSLPLIGLIAAYWVMPFTKDYIFSITLTSAAFVSFMICVYLFLFSKILKKYFKFKTYEIYGLTLAFFLAHFFVVKASQGVSPFLFGANDLTCFFHYIIPTIVNLCLIEYFIIYGLPKRIPVERGILHASLLLLAIYLAIFSNLMCNFVLIAFIAASVLWEYKTKLFCIKKWLTICKENPLLLGVLVLWFISIGFEMTGGRANSIHTSILQLPIKQTLTAGWHTLKSTSKFGPALMFGAMIISTYFIVFKERNVEQKERFLHSIGILFVTCFFTFAYLVLACSRTFPGYIGRPDILLAPVGILIMAVILMTAFLLEREPRLFLLAPFGLFVISIGILNTTYLEPTDGRVPPRVCYQMDYEFIEQIIAADQAHQKEIVLRVPKWGNGGNWPHNVAWPLISKAMYRHGLTGNYVKVTYQPDISMNEKYGLPIRK